MKENKTECAYVYRSERLISLWYYWYSSFHLHCFAHVAVIIRKGISLLGKISVVYLWMLKTAPQTLVRKWVMLWEIKMYNILLIVSFKSQCKRMMSQKICKRGKTWKNLNIPIISRSTAWDPLVRSPTVTSTNYFHLLFSNLKLLRSSNNRKKNSTSYALQKGHGLHRAVSHFTATMN
jgi:hypothetical protein